MIALPLLTVARRARLALALLMAVAVLGGAIALPAAADPSGGANNVVLATATADGATMSHGGVQVASVGSPTVTSDNIARAESDDCTGCRAAAAALQAVFITRNASTVTPANTAVAVNANCTGCDSFAFAYQYVLSTPGPVYLSGGAQQQIAQIRQEVAASVASALPDDQLDSQLHELAGEFKAVIDQNLQQAGVPATGTVDERVDARPAAG